jgi:alkane 1-monooxygenase
MAPKQLASAAGYGVIFIAPALLATSAAVGQPWLVFAVVLTLFPLARLLFGALSPGPAPLWSEHAALLLELLPRVFLFVLAGAVLAVLATWHGQAPTGRDAVAWTLSFWVTLVLATCVAHELIHRAGPGDRLAGHLLAGLTGYPMLGYEHLRHHRLAGSTSQAEWPRLDESVWRFARRRLVRIGQETLGSSGLVWRRESRSPTVRGLRWSLATTLVTFCLFGLSGGWVGVAIYGVAVLLASFAMQLVTYMQHWGLGDDSAAPARGRELAWEDDCRFQSWLTLGLSLHQGHHDAPSHTYFRIGLSPASPRLPTGYLLLMFAALVLPLWRRVMEPARQHWLRDPQAPASAGRRIVCTTAYR